MTPEFRYLSYESGLLECGLTTLETKILRRDQAKVIKMVIFIGICYPNINKEVEPEDTKQH